MHHNREKSRCTASVPERSAISLPRLGQPKCDGITGAEMSDTTTRLHLVARQEIDQQPRFRLLQSGSEVTCVDSRVAAEWVGACTISFCLEGVHRCDVLPSVDEALLAAWLLSSPLSGASDIRVEGSLRRDGYKSMLDWGEMRLGKVLLRELLSWWSL